VAVLKHAWERVRDYAIFESERDAYPQSFSEELNEQCGRILFVVSLITSVAWLPYIYLDAMLHPEEPLLPVIRIGLSVFSVIIFILYISKRFLQYNMLFLFSSAPTWRSAAGSSPPWRMPIPCMWEAIFSF